MEDSGTRWLSRPEFKVKVIDQAQGQPFIRPAHVWFPPTSSPTNVAPSLSVLILNVTLNI